MTFPAKCILFDLDGTLIDSFADIAHATNMALAEQGLPTRELDAMQKWVGNGSAKLISRAITGYLDGEVEPELLQRTQELFLQFYANNILVHSRIYDDVTATLEKLLQDGYQMGCVTNKPARHTDLLLEATGLDRFFGISVGGDSLPTRKPDPDQLLYAANHFGLTASDCVMVGDSMSDILAAKAAPMPVLCLTYGYNQGMDLSASDPEALLDSFADIYPLVTFSSNT